MRGTGVAVVRPTQPDFIFGLTPGDVVWDLETHPNCFTLSAIHATTGNIWQFEYSDYRNDMERILLFCRVLKEQGCRLVGFNSLGFDYPVLHMILQCDGICTPADIYQKAMSIIRGNSFEHMVWENNWYLPQIDLFKIHHFDNRARSTSLKVLEFNMRMDSVEDLPFPVGIALTPEQVSVLLKYNLHDVRATLDFLRHTQDQIRFREELTAKYGQSFMNHNDTKIGKDYFIMQLEEASPGSCYRYVDGKRKMVQTEREEIRFADVIFDYVQFREPEFNRVLDFFRKQVISPFETVGAFKDVNCTVRGFQFDFGAGGIHGSVDSQVVTSDDEWIIEDFDVASYYPNLAIQNRLYPQHLGETFCEIYADLYQQRKQHAKGSAENAMLKLALNGVYGDSNNQYSPFYDPQYTMSITINGQLLLCMLAEALMQYEPLQMIQINTDGLTVRYPRSARDWVHSICHWWEGFTKLPLESTEYRRMFIRDVNNYIGEYTDGSVKRKGAYEYELEWHQNHSMLIVPKLAEKALLRDLSVADAFHDMMTDTPESPVEYFYDFLLRAKVNRGSTLEWGGDPVVNIVRYYVSTDGDVLEKVMPAAGPESQFKKANGVSQYTYDQWHHEHGNVWNAEIHTKNQSTYEERRTGIHTGHTVQLLNRIEPERIGEPGYCDDINYDFYIAEAEKLVRPIRGW